MMVISTDTVVVYRNTERLSVPQIFVTVTKSFFWVQDYDQSERVPSRVLCLLPFTDRSPQSLRFSEFSLILRDSH